MEVYAQILLDSCQHSRLLHDPCKVPETPPKTCSSASLCSCKFGPHEMSQLFVSLHRVCWDSYSQGCTHGSCLTSACRPLSQAWSVSYISQAWSVSSLDFCFKIILLFCCSSCLCPTHTPLRSPRSRPLYYNCLKRIILWRRQEVTVSRWLALNTLLVTNRQSPTSHNTFNKERQIITTASVWHDKVGTSSYIYRTHYIITGRLAHKPHTSQVNITHMGLKLTVAVKFSHNTLRVQQ